MNDVKTLRIYYLYRNLLFHKHDSKFKCEIKVNKKVNEEFSIVNQC